MNKEEYLLATPVIESSDFYRKYLGCTTLLKQLIQSIASVTDHFEVNPSAALEYGELTDTNIFLELSKPKGSQFNIVNFKGSDSKLNMLCQIMLDNHYYCEAYLNRKVVLQSNGIDPSMTISNICYAFIPVDTLPQNLRVNDVIEIKSIFNKTLTLTIKGIYAADEGYRAICERTNKTYYICDLDEYELAYHKLTKENRRIYASNYTRKIRKFIKKVV